MNTLQDIAKVAANEKKLSKANIWYTARYIIEEAECRDEMDNDLFKRNLADLYNYFKPAPGKRPKTPFEWISKAMGKSDVRYYLNWIYCDGEKVIATDGHRLHAYILGGGDDIAEGFYDDQMNPVEDQGKYPNVDNVIPGNMGRETDLSTIIKTANDNIKIISAHKKPTEAVLLGKGYVNRKYFDDAITMFDPDKKVRLATTTDKAAIKLVQDNLLAVVMPVMVD